ncbi:unnamed protein product [Protopolystoma xenopodis]|uniref:EGF-like domain-containing protein n=1 Tax=Protopolystoma xenopodis TaxID=117903 RepID=A0A448WW13_9PLAT|nr:unnamed protein product [Protopolystoma xenopodis]
MFYQSCQVWHWGTSAVVLLCLSGLFWPVPTCEDILESVCCHVCRPHLVARRKRMQVISCLLCTRKCGFTSSFEPPTRPPIGSICAKLLGGITGLYLSFVSLPSVAGMPENRASMLSFTPSGLTRLLTLLATWLVWLSSDGRLCHGFGVFGLGLNDALVYADEFHVVVAGPCIHEGDAYCTRRVINSLCSMEKNECFCRPGYVSIQEDYGITCKTCKSPECIRSHGWALFKA